MRFPGGRPGIKEFTSNIRVQAGDHVGLSLLQERESPPCASQGYGISSSTADAGDVVGERDGAVGVGTAVRPGATPPELDLNDVPMGRVNLEATLTGTPLTPPAGNKPAKKCKKKAKKRSASVAKKK